MLTDVKDVQAWVASVIGTRYEASRGAFVETPALNETFIVGINQAGGRSLPHVLYRNFRIVLIGRRSKRSDAAQIEQDANALIKEVIRPDRQHPLPCGAGGMRLVADAAGVQYTTTDRAYYNLTIELLI